MKIFAIQHKTYTFWCNVCGGGAINRWTTETNRHRQIIYI